MRTALDNDTLTLCLEGHIDSNNAASVEAEIMSALVPGAAVILDAGDLEYISSAGLRMLMKLRKQFDTALPVLNVSPEVYEIFDVTGFTKLFDVRKRMREVSVEGCEIIGRGAVGTVYRLDADTIVKVYDVPNAMAMIENEQRLAKLAFLRGIPTAISYDIVKVGDHFGVVFELIRASSLADRFAHEPENTDRMAEMYADVIRQVHDVEMLPGELPDSRDIYAGYLDVLADTLGSELASKLRALIGAMPQDLHVIHGDFHMKNLLFSDDEPILIDMDTLCVGNLAFELAGLFVAYKAFGEDEPDNCLHFFGVPDETVAHIWDKLMASFPGAAGDGEDRVLILGYIRFLYLLAVLQMGPPEKRQDRIRRTVSRLDVLAARVNGLTI